MKKRTHVHGWRLVRRSSDGTHNYACTSCPAKRAESRPEVIEYVQSRLVVKQ